jgi:choline dehydrogenase-like flavoprotein
VISCGAIGSSGLLLKSGIRKNVGTRLSFNAGAACTVEFEQPIDTWDADQMSVYIKGDGYNIEPVHNPPGATALMIPGWFGEHGDLMRRYRHITFAGALVGTEAVGRVVHSPFFGHEETRFRMPDGDLAKLKRGLKDVARAFFAAGAKRVILPTHVFQALERIEDVDRIDSAFHSTRELGVGSSHPQGGNPLSEDPDLGVVDEDFAVHGFENLFVCDASVFTSCIKVNPIDTIMAMADYAAPRILGRA